MSRRILALFATAALLAADSNAQEGPLTQSESHPPALESGPRHPAVAAPMQQPVVTPESFWWFEPRYWYGPVWEGGFELGVNGAEGNNQAFTIQTGAKLKRKCETHELALEITYVKTAADGDTTQHNSLTKLRYDRLFCDSPWTLFIIGHGVYDELKPFGYRVAANGGVGYRFINNPCTTWAGRFGAGFSHEIGGPDDDYVPEADFGVDFEHKISKRQKFTLTFDYYPAWDDYEDYRILADAAWELLLDAETNLSLKIGVIDRYDSTPNGAKRNDVNYSLLLLWKI